MESGREDHGGDTEVCPRQGGPWAGQSGVRSLRVLCARYSFPECRGGDEEVCRGFQETLERAEESGVLDHRVEETTVGMEGCPEEGDWKGRVLGLHREQQV